MCFGKRPAQGDDTGADLSAANYNARPSSITKTSPKVAKMPAKGMSDSYAAPSGPPPAHSYLGLEQDTYAPLPGPSPGQHDWQSAVPDTSLLPPPPMLGYDSSPTNNATEDQANRAISWCNQNPLKAPVRLAPQGIQTLQSGVFGLSLAPGFLGEGKELRPGVFGFKTQAGTPDTCITSGLPMYAVNLHSPLQTGQSKTIYFEVKFARSSLQEIDVGLGFVAAPYPPFRLPGWERASLGIHGDDGHRYVNDKWGGKDFTRPFKAGETVGVGMSFSPRQVNAPPAYSNIPTPAQTTANTPINIEVFFTRNGQKDGGWNLHEENDASQDLPVTGLEGMNDLYASVGMFEANEFEIVFNSRDWLYQI